MVSWLCRQNFRLQSMGETVILNPYWQRLWKDCEEGGRNLLYDTFNDVYQKFKMHFYHEVFHKLNGREASLTTVETFCMEIIYSLDKPTVSEFSEFASLSSANAADKINNLIRKGYLRKVQSTEDKRKYYLEVTQKYLDYYNISYQYVKDVMERIQSRFTPEELVAMEKILTVMNEEMGNFAIEKN